MAALMLGNVRFSAGMTKVATGSDGQGWPARQNLAESTAENGAPSKSLSETSDQYLQYRTVYATISPTSG
jgi:hypothetical protein